MTIQQLEYICALAHHRHFVKAATACNVTQPTLSMMIQKLEDELGIMIFDRGNHPITITSIGEKIISQAKTTLNELHRIAELAGSETKQVAGDLRIGVIPTVAPYLVPKLIMQFRNSYPQVSLSVKEMTTRSIITYLLQSDLDMAILATPLAHQDILEIPLYYEKFVAYFSTSYLDQNLPLRATDLPLEHIWVLQEGHCLRTQVFNFCHNPNMENREYEAGSIDTLVKIVDQNGGYSVIPELHIEFLNEEQRKHVRQIDNPPAVREISIVIKKNYVREGMINAVVNIVKQLIPPHMIDERLKKFAVKL